LESLTRRYFSSYKHVRSISFPDLRGRRHARSTFDFEEGTSRTLGYMATFLTSDPIVASAASLFTRLKAAWKGVGASASFAARIIPLPDAISSPLLPRSSSFVEHEANVVRREHVDGRRLQSL